ncbi:arginyltransferase [Marinobacterium arenosum]|uniref:arginyltransferase n=1 Tax=Marinobacterium arenosum TaxID=2862496 RepID=UPI001C970617|nr:arginyltransferase [Marinobacterium arenosum]MBY4677859.1 arginyltransferase [Marinobacterium arenosum]
MTNLRSINFYATPGHHCSYLPNREAKTLFVDPQAIIAKDTYSQLSELGFRRSGRHIYRPHCGECQACISVRIPCTQFRPTRSQKRILARNRDLKVRVVSPQLNREYYQLYERYIIDRHADGDMYPPSEEQFMSFLVEGDQESVFFEFRDRQNKLIALAVSDFLEEGLSAIYTFFEPAEYKRSLGSYAILWQISECERLKLPYLYLGYWVKDCRKMNYKLAYRPIEMLLDNSWVLIR